MMASCVCLSEVLEDAEQVCNSDLHTCICSDVIIEESVFSYLIKNCKALSTHHVCICAHSVVTGQDNTEDSRGVKWCRATELHSCVCGLLILGGPSRCKAFRHLYCICGQTDTEECRIAPEQQEDHNCVCLLSSKNICRAVRHQCSCLTVPPFSSECKSRYGYHNCICRLRHQHAIITPSMACRSRIHTD